MLSFAKTRRPRYSTPHGFAFVCLFECTTLEPQNLCYVILMHPDIAAIYPSDSTCSTSTFNVP